MSRYMPGCWTILEKADKMVYITDNCGEIVCDKLVVEEMQKRFPGLDPDRSGAGGEYPE